VLLHISNVWEAQFPICILFNGAHERVGNSYGDIEVRDLIFICLGRNKVFHIGMIDAQDGHIGATARVVRDHAISKVCMVIRNFQVKC
jgi:hypothetical protein